MASTGAQPRRGDGEATPANHHCRHRHRFVSDDLNVRVQGKILEQKEPGRIDGIRLELDLPDEDEGDAAGGDDANEREDAITVVSLYFESSVPCCTRRLADPRGCPF